MILLYTPGLSWSIWFDAYLGLGAAALPQEELEGECTYAGVNFRKPWAHPFRSRVSTERLNFEILSMSITVLYEGLLHERSQTRALHCKQHQHLKIEKVVVWLPIWSKLNASQAINGARYVATFLWTSAVLSLCHPCSAIRSTGAKVRQMHWKTVSTV